MPWNPRFNYVLGGAAGGMAQLGRGATLAQVLAAAAMGSTEAMSYVEKLKLKQQEAERRRLEDAADRKMRQEEHDARMKEANAKLASDARQEAAGRVKDEFATEHLDPNFMGPPRQDLPPEAFAEPGDRFAWAQKQQDAKKKAAQAADDIKFLLEKGIPPSSDPKVNQDVRKKIMEGMAEPTKPPFTQEQLYQHQRDKEQDQLKVDTGWSEWQYETNPSVRQKQEEKQQQKDWKSEFNRQRTIILTTGGITAKKLSTDELNQRAELQTEMTLGYPKPRGAMGSSSSAPVASPSINRGPKAPPKDEQPFAAGLTGLPPTGSAVASPTGATAPPSIVPKRNIAPAPAMINNLSAAIDAAIPDMDQRTKISAEAKIKLDMLQDPTITPDEAIRQLKEQWNHYRFQMRGGANLMGNPGGQ